MAACDPKPPVGYVHSLESFGSVDGPGVRFVVFLQGCALRCKYCHNPETWAAEGGEEWTAEKLFQRVYRYRNYWGKKGGITVSGGEPLRQMEFLTAFFELARSKGVLVFPAVVGGSFIVGGEYGRGALRVDGKTLDYYSTTAASIGLQAGAQSKAVYYVFNTRDALELTLKSLAATTRYPRCRLWIGDNGSTDGSVEFLDDLARQIYDQAVSPDF